MSAAGRCIVCGAGPTGLHVMRELSGRGIPVCLVDESGDALERAGGDTLVETVAGSPLEDSVLESAGIAGAKALFATMPDDRSNVFLTLSARRLNPDLRVFSVALDGSAERKLHLVGCAATVNPHLAEGFRLSTELLRPDVARFTDGLVFGAESEAGYISVTVPTGSPSDGSTLADLDLGGRTGVVLVAVRRREGTTDYSPKGSLVVRAGDALVGFGSGTDAEAMESALAEGPARRRRRGLLARLLGRGRGGRT